MKRERKKRIYYQTVMWLLLSLWMTGCGLTAPKAEGAEENVSSGENFIEGISMKQDGNVVHFGLVGCEDPAQYEYEFRVRIGEDEEKDWRIESSFGSDFLDTYSMVSGGVYHFRYLIRDKETRAVQDIYIGDIDKGPVWVNSLAVRPSALTVDLNAPLHIEPVLSEEVDPDTLVYQVLVKYNQDAWSVASDYQSLPLEPVVMEQEGVCNICIKSYQEQSGQSQVSESIQLNVAKYHEENEELLMRNLLSNYSYYDYGSDEELYRSLAKELMIFSNVFLYEYRGGEDTDGFLAKIQEYYPVRKKAGTENILEVQNEEGCLKQIDLDHKLILYGNSYISIALEDHPVIKEVIAMCKDDSDKEICAFIINNLLHNAYRYTLEAASVENWNGFQYTEAQCGQFAEVLTYLLGEAGYKVRNYSCGRGEYGEHSVVEVDFEGKKTVLDPTYNVAYLLPLEKLPELTDERIKIFPQVFDRYEFYRSESWNNLSNYGVTNEYPK